MALPKISFPAFVFLMLAAVSAKAQYYYASYQQPAYSYYRPQASQAYDEGDYGSPRAKVIQGGSRPTVEGNRAIVRHGVAYAPSNAPEAVKRAIWATNSLHRLPYKWGGGHGSFSDDGYDCSGTVSFALHYAGVLGAPAQSSELENFGEHGRGHWITVYARNGHTFAVIAGLRLDTTGYYGTEGPRWHTDGRDTWGYEARHPYGM
jgi:cell wall-associated NlpC family hydrolase